jgi:hypothetical protein
MTQIRAQATMICAVCALFAAILPALARPIDAPTVTAFLAACAKDKTMCNDEVIGLVNDAYIPDRSGDVCLSDDQLDQPGTIAMVVLKYLGSRRDLARLKPAEAILQVATVLYPCVDTSPEPDGPDAGSP